MKTGMFSAAVVICLLPSIEAQRPSRANRGGDEAWKLMAERHDKDQDGVITADEYERGEGTFKRLDRNGDGELTAADFSGSGRATRGQMMARMATPLLRAAAGPGGSEVTGESWETWVDSVAEEGVVSSRALVRSGLQAQRARPLIRALDRDRDGELQVAELVALFATLDAEGKGSITVPAGGGARRGAGRSDRDDGVPKVGEVAPDFELPRVDDAEKLVCLSSFRGDRAVALIFGSYT